MPTLTPRQKQIYDYIKSYIKKKGFSPTFEEIKKRFKLKALSGVHQHIEALIEKRLLSKNLHSARGIELYKEDLMVKVPLLGTIAAGEPIGVVEEKELIAVPKSKLPRVGDVYALRVIGDSMIEENINDGDTVLIKNQPTAMNGEKVVALINNEEATLKKFYKEKNQIRLQPANKKYDPIIIKKKQGFVIQGIVIDVIKSDNWDYPETAVQTKTEITSIGTKKLINKVTEGDCLEVMENIPDNSIDMILCDLPYGHTQNTWDSIIPLDKLWNHYERIIKNNGAIALTSQGVFTAKLILSNPTIFKYKITWVKSKPTNFLNAKKQPLRKHEDICVFYKNQPDYSPQMTLGEPYNKGIRKDQLTGSYGDFNTVEVKSDGARYPTDVVYFKTAESEGKSYHPTQKPVELGRYLIKTFTKPNDIVLDNTCGSGSFLVSAVLENRRFIGIEKNQETYLHKKKKVDYIKICNDRIEKAKKNYKINHLSIKYQYTLHS